MLPSPLDRRHNPRGRDSLEHIVLEGLVKPAITVSRAQFLGQGIQNGGIISPVILVIGQLGTNEGPGAGDNTIRGPVILESLTPVLVQKGIGAWSGDLFILAQFLVGYKPAQFTAFGGVMVARVQPGSPVFDDP